MFGETASEPIIIIIIIIINARSSSALQYLMRFATLRERQEPSPTKRLLFFFFFFFIPQTPNSFFDSCATVQAGRAPSRAISTVAGRRVPGRDRLPREPEKSPSQP